MTSRVKGSVSLKFMTLGLGLLPDKERGGGWYEEKI